MIEELYNLLLEESNIMRLTYLIIGLPSVLITFFLDGLPKLNYMSLRMTKKFMQAEKEYAKLHCQNFSEDDIYEFIYDKNGIKI